ncbi:MAG TPA: hypothetical protein VGM03_09545 [Phycisphaerae bacterium]
MRQNLTIAFGAGVLVLACSFPVLAAPGDADARHGVAVPAPTSADKAVEKIRVGTVKAHALLLAGKVEEASTRVVELLDAVEALPEGVERAPLIKKLEDLLEQASVQRAEHRPAQTSDLGPPVAGDLGAGDQAAECDPLPGVGDRPSEREARHNDKRRFRYEGELRRGYKSDEADELVRIGESCRIPAKIMTYPPDWCDITARRREYDGTLYKSRPFVDKDGQTKQTVIYDMSELLFEPPEFTDSFEFDIGLQLQNQLDRQALRDRSEIFRAGASELAAGLPLLQFFGGLDESRVRTRPTGERRAEMLHMIQQVMEARNPPPAAPPPANAP